METEVRMAWEQTGITLNQAENALDEAKARVHRAKKAYYKAEGILDYKKASLYQAEEACNQAWAVLNQVEKAQKQETASIVEAKQVNLFPEFLEACKMAEPVLDGTSATWNEGGNTAINKARPAWEAVKAVIAKAELL